MILVDSPIELAHETRLAKMLCQWLSQPEDSILYHSVIAVNLALQQGHSCLYLPDWAEGRLQCGLAYQYELPTLPQWSAALEALAPLSVSNDEAFPLVYENQRLYLRRYWNFEQQLSSAIGARLSQSNLSLTKATQERFDRLFASSEMLDWQKIAAKNALLNRFSVIAGGPGTGKTYTVTRMLACLLAQYQESDRQPNIKLVAPTGKAAQRLTESIASAKQALKASIGESWVEDIPEAASTIHRLLGVIPNNVNFKHNERQPLDIDWLLVDEASMVDLPLMCRLFRALPEKSNVILLGDAEQLPSVAAGSVLADLTPRPHPGYSPERVQELGLSESYSGVTDANYLTYLEKSHRFDGKGGIGILAKQVISGEVESSWTFLNQHNEQLALISETDRDRQVIHWVKKYYLPVTQAINVASAWALFSEFRLLCATRVGPQGTLALNNQVCQILGQSTVPFRGQPIMVTENDYRTGLFNGDVGLVWEDEETGLLLVWFPDGSGGFRAIPFARLPTHDTVFAMTIHKTQGSEFSQVVMLLPDAASKLLSRELIYTGLTRAKKHFSYCGAPWSWKQAVTSPVVRHSGLRERVQIQSARMQPKDSIESSKPIQLDMGL